MYLTIFMKLTMIMYVGSKRLQNLNTYFMGGTHMHEYDDAVLNCFLKNQLQLFPEEVAETMEEAENFLEECLAVVVDSVEEVIEFFEEEGIDMDGADGDEILEAAEVFDVGDGRYLIVEG